MAPAHGPFVPWMGVAVSEARSARADGDHCREMAGKLRELARYTRSPGMRRELFAICRVGAFAVGARLRRMCHRR
jgi:hypothetical protein